MRNERQMSRFLAIFFIYVAVFLVLFAAAARGGEPQQETTAAATSVGSFSFARIRRPHNAAARSCNSIESFVGTESLFVNSQQLIRTRSIDCMRSNAGLRHCLGLRHANC